MPMYMPFARLLIIIFAVLLVLLMAATLKSLIALSPLVFAGVSFLLFKYGRYIFYAGLSRERLLRASSPLDIRLHRDFMEVYLGGDDIQVAVFIDVGIPPGETDEEAVSLAKRFINSLHGGGFSSAILVLRNGRATKYYLRVSGRTKLGLRDEFLRGLASITNSLLRQLLDMGLHAKLAEVRLVLEDMRVEPVKVAVRPKVPVTLAAVFAAFTAAVLCWLSGLWTTSYVAAALSPLLLVGFNHIKPYLGGVVLARVGWSCVYELRSADSTIPTDSQLRTRMEVVKQLTLTSDPFLLVIELTPEDVHKLELEVRKALEVLEAGRAGVSRLSDEMKAVSILQLGEALGMGALPFRWRMMLFADGEEPARLLAQAGCWASQARGSRLTGAFSTLLCNEEKLHLMQRLEDRVNPIYIPRHVGVSFQLAHFAPWSFSRQASQKTGRAVRIGRDVKGDPVYIELDSLPNIHGLLVGPMGSGKSTTARAIMMEVSSMGMMPIVIDPSGEYIPFVEFLGGLILKPGDTFFDPLESTRDFWVEEFQKALSYLTRLKDSELSLIAKLASQSSSLADLLDNAYRRGGSLSVKLGVIREFLGARKTLPIREILSLGKPVALCLSGGRGEAMPVEVMRFTTHMFIAQLTQELVERGLSEPRYLLVMDEAWLLSLPPPGGSESLATTISRMFRKFGLAVLLVAHDWSDIDPVYRKHSGWRIAMASSDPEYLSATASYLRLTPGEVRWLSEGIRGRAVLRMQHKPYSLPLQVEPPPAARTDYWHRND